MDTSNLTFYAIITMILSKIGPSIPHFMMKHTGLHEITCLVHDLGNDGSGSELCLTVELTIGLMTAVMR